MKKFMVTAIILCMIISLSGCVWLNSDMSGLLRAPKIPKESKQLQEALSKAIGDNAKYVFPQSGQYKSAIIQKDIDGDMTDEAIVFYFSDVKGKTARINILDKIDNKWTTIYDIEGHGSDIDVVDFCDFNNDNKQELIVGWQLYTSQGRGLSVYDLFMNGTVKEVYNTPYTEMLILKNAVSTSPALLTLNLNTHKKASTAKLTMFRDNELKDIAKCEMDGTVINHRQVTEAYVSNNKKAVIVDGETNGLYSTQILFWDGKALTNPYYNNKRLNDALKRHSKQLCADIDKDGIVEIPKAATMPNIITSAEKNSAQATVDLTVWNEWDPVKILKYDFSAIMNETQRYYFVFPPDFNGKVTVKNDSIAEKYIFYMIKGNGESSEELFSISCLNNSDWLHRSEQGGWKALKKDSGKVFAASIPKTLSQEAQTLLSTVDLSKNFVIMNGTEGY